MHTRINKLLKKDFDKYSKRLGTTSSQLVREWVEKFVAEESQKGE